MDLILNTLDSIRKSPPKAQTVNQPNKQNMQPQSQVKELLQTFKMLKIHTERELNKSNSATERIQLSLKLAGLTVQIETLKRVLELK